jgi:hypothetical protein
MWNIVDFGAISSDSLQTKAIQQAIDACFLAGGGNVRVPAGVYRMGCVRLRSNVALHLESGAMLVGSRNPEDYTDYIHDAIEPIEGYDRPDISRSVYPFSRWNNAMIRVIHAENVAIIGEKGSFIDGSNCFDEQGEEGYRGPHGINIQDSRKIRLEGYTLRNCGNWAHALFKTSDIVARRVTVYAGHDGFDVRTCDNVLIEECSFSTGDDCIAGYDNHEVIIRRCHLNSSCDALRFGGNNVLVEDCEAVGPGNYAHRYTLSRELQRIGAGTDEACRRNLCCFFVYYCDLRANPRRKPEDILIKNCRIVEADRLVMLDFGPQHIWCCNRSLAGIRFENCRIEGVSHPVRLYGDEKEKLTFEMEDVVMTAREGSEDACLFEAKHCEAISLKNVQLKGFRDPRMLLRSTGRIDVLGGTPVRCVVEEG